MTDVVEQIRNLISSEAPNDSLWPWVSTILLRNASDEIERLRAALKQCEQELDEFYSAEYDIDHPVYQKKLTQELANNPARVALEKKDD